MERFCYCKFLLDLDYHFLPLTPKATRRDHWKSYLELLLVVAYQAEGALHSLLLACVGFAC